MLSRKYGVTAHSLYNWFKKAGLKLRDNHTKNVNRATCNEHYFDVIDSSDKAYWLGFLSADGFVTTPTKGASPVLGLTLKESDTSHIEKLLACLESTHKIHTYTVTSGYKIGTLYSRVLIPNQHLVETMHKYNIRPDKTTTFKPVDVPHAFRRDYIRGMFDGDGCITAITANKNVPQYSCEFLGTDATLDYITQCLMDEEIITHKYYYDRRKPGQPVAAFKLGGNNMAYKAATYLYKDSNMYLDRKYKRYQDLSALINSRS